MRAGGIVGAMLAVIAGAVLAAAAMAQGTPQFRDARTGTIWTPDNVSRDSRLESANPPSSPADRAFDPRSQVVAATGVVVQRPTAQVMGTVPITAGPSVPIAVIDAPSLLAIPSDRWVTDLYVTNNSAFAINPEVGCTFMNGGNPVQETQVIVPTAGPGQRLGLPVYGPRTNIFVDRVACRLLRP